MVENPRLIFWELTKSCNLKCAYCRVIGSLDEQELNTQEALSLLDDIKSEFKDVILILSGGEPFMRKDLNEILAHAQRIDLKVSLATNGTMLDRKKVKNLKEFDVKRVSLSLDSTFAEKHDLARGLVGSYKKTVTGAKFLKRMKVPFQINFTVSRSNMDQLNAVAELAQLLGAVAVHYFVVVPVGCGKNLDESEMLDPYETQHVLKTIRNLTKMLPIEIRPTCAPQYVRFTGGRSGGCLAGTRVMFISAEGDVYPCGYLPAKAGSVRKKSIGDIWRTSEVFADLRKNDLRGMCSDCSLKMKCRGCRARAFSKTGNYLDEDSSCIRQERRQEVLL